MGIAGSIVNQDFFEDYLGMRVECVDMSELVRRIEENIYDGEEFKRAYAWVRKNCPEGKDHNKKPARPQAQRLGMGVCGEVRDDRARPDGRQPAAGQTRFRRGSPRP